MTERTEIPTGAIQPVAPHAGSYVDWASILAGAVVASGIAFVFSTFGAALGLSLVSPYDGDGSAIAAAVAVGSWMLWTTISSFAAGGYIAGRMRRRIEPASTDEVAIRDGIHGLTVWGVAVLIGAVLLASGVNTAVQTTADTAATVAAAAQDTVGQVAQTVTEGATQDDAAAQAEPAARVDSPEAKAAAEEARKYSVISAFVLAASLMIAAAAAYWAAGVGGQHRDEGRVFDRFGRWT